jgi:hypothetical protein
MNTMGGMSNIQPDFIANPVTTGAQEAYRAMHPQAHISTFPRYGDREDHELASHYYPGRNLNEMQ